MSSTKKTVPYWLQISQANITHQHPDPNTGLCPELQYISHNSFDDQAMEKEIDSPIPRLAEYETASKLSKSQQETTLEMALLDLYPVLARDQEAHLFRLMNFLKHKANTLRHDVNAYNVLYRKYVTIRNWLISANYRLLISYVRKIPLYGRSFFEVVADGVPVLMNAVAKFNFSFGNKFSTYASWAFIRWHCRYNDPPRCVMYTNTSEEFFELNGGTEELDFERVGGEIDPRYKVMYGYLNDLDHRECTIIKLRFGLAAKSPTGTDTWTLEQIGSRLGITRERVRQIEARAKKKMKGYRRPESNRPENPEKPQKPRTSRTKRSQIVA